MSVLDSFSRGDRPINHNSSFSLTERGKARLSEVGYNGNPRDRLLVVLETSGSSASIEDLHRSSGMPSGQIERLLSGLIRSGLAQDVASSPTLGEEF